MLDERDETRSGWRGARRLLCIRLDTLGDVLMTGPAIRALKTGRQDRHVTVLTSRWGAEAAGMIPEVDEVMVYDAPWLKATASRRSSRPDLAMVRRLAEGQYDGAVIFTVYSQSALPAALLCYLAGIPLRLAHCRENPYQLLTNWVRDTEPEAGFRHEVRRQLDLVATIGARPTDERLSVTIPSAAGAAVDELLRHLVGEEERWIVLHPGATAASRRYSPDGFAVVGERLARELGATVLLTGTASEAELIGRVRSAVRGPSHSLAGLLDLPMLAALLRRAPLLISNNTGAVHVAAAVGTPVVDLYALTNPQHTPWQIPSRVLFHDVPCKYCYKSVCPEGHHDCLRLVSPETVVAAALELLDATTPHAKGLRLVHPRH